MFKRTTAILTAAIAIPFVLSGCSSNATVDPPKPVPDASSQLQELRDSGKLPETFPKETKDLRVEVDGKEFGISWKGDRISGDCKASDAPPNATTSILLLQDAGLENIQQCGDIYQATQADGSIVAWN